MRSTFKTITFDQDFAYSKNGEFVTAREITVCEPNYDRRHVYRTMRAYLAEAEVGVVMKFSGLKRSEPTKADAVDAAMAAAEPAKPTVEPDALEQMRMGLSMEAFPKFCDYVQKELTGCKQLCFVGADMSGEIKDRAAVTEEVWMAIAKTAGCEAIDQVLSAFTSFFSGYQPETVKTTG